MAYELNSKYDRKSKLKDSLRQINLKINVKKSVNISGRCKTNSQNEFHYTESNIPA